MRQDILTHNHYKQITKLRTNIRIRMIRKTLTDSSENNRSILA